MIELRFLAPPERWIRSICQNGDATVKVLSMKMSESSKDANVAHFIDIISNKLTAEDMTMKLRRSPDVKDSELAGVGPGRIVGTVTSSDCKVCSMIINSKTGCFVGPVVSDHDCRMNYRLLMSGDGISKFLQKLGMNGIEYEISEISGHRAMLRSGQNFEISTLHT